MIKELANNLVLSFAFLLAKLPVWVFLVVCLFYERMPFEAAVPLFFAIVLAKGLLYRWEYGRGLAYSTSRSLWKYFLRPVFFFAMFVISCFALAYLFSFDEMLDWQIALAAFGAAVCALIAKVFEGKSQRMRRKSFFPKTFVLSFTITLLWLYVLAMPDGYNFALGALLLIYLLEFLTSFGLERDMAIEGLQ